MDSVSVSLRLSPAGTVPPAPPQLWGAGVPHRVLPEPQPAVPAFRPLPLLGNRHIQTLLGHLLPVRRLRHPSVARHLDLPDGDRLVLHDSVPDGWKPGDRVALLVHGLGGCAGSAHMLRTTAHLIPLGVRVVRMDLRGCGHGERLARGLYHGGCSDDIRAAAVEVHRWAPSSPLLLVGYSLGGNIVLKAAAEADEYPVPGLAGVAAVAPPIDLERSIARLSEPQNWYYARYFLRLMVCHAQRWQRRYPELLPVQFPRDLTVPQFNELFIAPLHGFRRAADYYRSVSSLPFISRIRVPGLMVASRDDPFIALEPFEQIDPPPHVEVQIVDQGGHLGFLGPDGAGGIHWAERRIATWVARAA